MLAPLHSGAAAHVGSNPPFCEESLILRAEEGSLAFPGRTKPGLDRRRSIRMSRFRSAMQEAGELSRFALRLVRYLTSRGYVRFAPISDEEVREAVIAVTFGANGGRPPPPVPSSRPVAVPALDSIVRRPLRDYTSAELEDVIRKTSSISEASRRLGFDRRTVREALRKHNLWTPPHERRG